MKKTKLRQIMVGHFGPVVIGVLPDRVSSGRPYRYFSHIAFRGSKRFYWGYRQ